MMYSFQKKENLIKNMHLKKYDHYDHLLFHQFLAQSRILNNHNLVYFSMISTGASYGHGVSSNGLIHLTSSGLSCTYKTMMKKLKEFNHNMDEVITKCLSTMKHYVIVLDNNQKGNVKKYQRNGSSNEFVKVTGRFFRECNLFNVEDHIEKESKDGHVEITYINQIIPSMYSLPAFEMFMPLTNNHNTTAYQIANYDEWTQPLSSIDYSGERVKRYIHLLNTSDIIATVVTKYLTNYNTTKKTYKSWNYQPDRFNTVDRKSLSQHLNKMKHSKKLKSYIDFQSNILNITNPHYNEETKILIPQVSLRDEITTNGYGMAVVELLVSTGIMKCVPIPQACCKWVLTSDYHKKIIYLCMDGLSLERHRSFMKKLMNIPQSYEKNFHQSIAFQRAIGQVVEISGPLHVAFHMLQTIYIIFGTLL